MPFEPASKQVEQFCPRWLTTDTLTARLKPTSKCDRYMTTEAPHRILTLTIITSNLCRQMPHKLRSRNFTTKTPASKSIYAPFVSFLGSSLSCCQAQRWALSAGRYSKYLTTRNQYMTVNGQQRTAWTTDAKTFYTYAYFGETDCYANRTRLTPSISWSSNRRRSCIVSF